MKKIIIITISLVVIIIVALAIFLKIYVTPEKIKEFLVPVAEESLSRKIRIGEIGVSLMKGIRIQGFGVKEADEKTDFLSCEEFVLKFKLLPLLSKKVIIDELRLLSPSIRVERTKSGKFNFQDIGKKKSAEEREEKRSDTSEGLPVSLLVRNVSVKDANFVFIDQTGAVPDLKGSLSIDMKMSPAGDEGLLSSGNINLKVSELSRKEKVKKTIGDINALLEYDAGLNPGSGEIMINKADLRLNQILVSIKGKTGDLLTTPRVDLSVSVPDLDLGDLQMLLSGFTSLDGLKLSGRISGDLTVKGMPANPESITTDGTLSLKNVDFKFDNKGALLDGIITFSTQSDNLSIPKADLRINGLSASLKGKLEGLKTSPNLDMSLSLPKSDASVLQKAVSSFAKLEGLSLTGNLSGDIRLNGSPAKLESLKANGNIALDKIEVTYEEIKALLHGSLKITDTLLNIDLKSTIGKNTAELKGTVSSYVKNQKINMRLYAKELFIDELIQIGKRMGTSGSGKETPDKHSSGDKKEETKPISLNMTSTGEIRVDSAVYSGLTMQNFIMNYQFINNSLNISKLIAHAGKGKFNLTGSLDLSKPGYRYNLSGNIDSLYAEEIINALFPKSRDTVFGVIKTDLKLNGGGTLIENIRKNLVADGNFDIQNGKVTNIGLTNNLSALFNLPELKTIHFNQASGAVRIRNGIAKLSSIFTSNDLEMNPGGDIGLDGDLALAFDLKLSPRLTGKAVSSSIAKYMTDQRGWGTVPIICPGTMSKPSCGPDLAKTGSQIIEKKLNKVFEKLLNKGQKTPPPDATEPGTPAPRETEPQPAPADPLKEMLKQLF